MKHFLLSILLFTSVNMLHAQKKVQVFYEDVEAKSTYTFDKFRFAHQFFPDMFYITDLYKQLSALEMAELIETVRQKISASNAIKIVFEQPIKPDATLVFSIAPDTKDGPIIIMSTNFDPKTRQFSDTSEDNVVRWYFIKGNVPVYRKDLFSSEEEALMIKEKNRQGLIDLYLFDELSDNDAKAKKLIDEIFSDTKSTEVETLYAYLYSQQYFLATNDFKSAEKANQDLNAFYNKNSGDTIPTKYKLIQDMANTELEIMKLIH